MLYHSHAQNSAEEYSLSQHGPAFKLSDHFRLIEFACRDGSDRVLVHPALVEGLEEIRAYFDGAPITINSGYRTPTHNARIGGVSKSRHLYGLAADIVVRSAEVKLWQVRRKAAQMQFGGIGKYRTFVHLDVWGENRRW